MVQGKPYIPGPHNNAPKVQVHTDLEQEEITTVQPGLTPSGNQTVNGHPQLESPTNSRGN